MKLTYKEINKRKELKILALLSRKKKLEGIQLIAEADEQTYRDRNKIEFFKPYSYQQAVCEAFRNGANIVIQSLSNKVGKCLTSQSLIETPRGEISMGELFEAGKSFEVYAWDGKKKVVAKAKPPFKKDGLHNCYRINFSDGRFVEAADGHRVFCSDGKFHTVFELVSLFPFYRRSTFSGDQLPFEDSLCLMESSSEFYRSSRILNGQSSCQTQSDYRGGYFEDRRQYGEQSHSYREAVQVFVPLQADVQQHSFALSGLDGLVNKYTNILQQVFFRLSNLYDRLLSLGQFHIESLFHSVCKFYELSAETFQAFSQPSKIEALGSQLILSPCLSLISEVSKTPHANKFSLVSPFIINGNKVISYNFIGKQEVFDFEVEKYHNYFAGGMIHHNTTIGACLVHSWANGYEPWNPVLDTFEGAVRVGDRFFMPSSLGIKPPVDIRITGEDWEQHLACVIVPELKKWAREDEYEVKKNNVGVEATWRHKATGSTLGLMTYKQDPDLYESWLGHGWWPDEPPPEPIWSGMSRGLFITGGKVFMSMTPLKEPWIYDDLIMSMRPDIKIIEDVSLWDCPHLYNDDLNTLMKCGFTKEEAEKFLSVQKEEARQTKFLPECEKILRDKLGKRTVNFMNQFGQNVEMDAHTYASQSLKIYRFIRDLKDDTERIPRVFGKPKHLMGLILKEFNKDIHIIKAFKIPTDWIVTPFIDIHLNTPQAISFYAVDRHGINYVIDEIWEHLSPDEIADEIIRKKEQNTWYIDTAFIDPLSKGDSAYIRNREGVDVEDSFNIIANKLYQHDIKLIAASKDKKSGILNLTDRLIGVNKRPTLFFFDSLPSAARGVYGHLYEITHWVYDDDGIPAKKDDHFMENLYRYTLAGIDWNFKKMSVDDVRKLAQQYRAPSAMSA